MDKDRTVRLLAVGDISLQTRGDRDPFACIKQKLEEADILFGNLETVLSHGGEESEKTVLLRNPPERIKYLSGVGFNVVNIANNHILDFGPGGFNDTLDVLSRADIRFTGGGNRSFPEGYAALEIKGQKFVFLGYCMSGRKLAGEGIFTNRLDEEKVVADIGRLRGECDHLIVSLHWGIENVFHPSPSQARKARRFIDEGADVIIGHHPHVPQAVERYNKGVIVYSLGNFQFDRTVSRTDTDKSFIFEAFFGKKGEAVEHEIHPVQVDDSCSVHPCDARGSKEVRDLIDELSRSVVSGEMTKGEWYEDIAETYLLSGFRGFPYRIRKYGFRHLLQFFGWLAQPLCIKCYLGLIRKKLRKIGQRSS